MQATGPINLNNAMHNATILPFQVPGKPDSYNSRCPREGCSRVLDAKEHLFEEGDPATHIYVVESGHICIYRLMRDGRRQIVDFAYPGDIVGLGAVLEHDANAMASERSRVSSFPVSALDEIGQRDPAFRAKLYSALSEQLHTAQELLLTVGRRTAPERLAAFLLTLRRRERRNGKSPCEIVLPMSRADIADFLALTIETVSRTFSKFRADGLVKIEQSILITILDVDGLKKLASGCDR